ncbi:hypothetical protein [Arthrobacter sp. ISL-5]|uniref:hypothetical protein n=1 Tax=Arthrobacter sp. ISL-5 TaxID=2819111 RepID=UPI001BEBEADD|nr:hypothetical protein [Arthrobacter sp. ISL-5]MBT2552781.1 hypothetical protein [Arthrobacter sp. ISL-5]
MLPDRTALSGLDTGYSGQFRGTTGNFRDATGGILNVDLGAKVLGVLLSLEFVS